MWTRLVWATDFLNCLVRLKGNIRHSGIQHQGEQIQNEVGRPAHTHTHTHTLVSHCSVRQLWLPSQCQEGIVAVLPELLVL